MSISHSLEKDKGVVNTTLSLGNLDTTFVSSSVYTRNRKKPRKQLHPVSTNTPHLPRSVKSKLQPGFLISIDRRTELYKMFCKANWEPILYYNNKKFFSNLVSAFYNNMEVRLADNDVVFLTSVVNEKPILLDHIELGKALKLSQKSLKLANIDLEKEFVFNKMELKLFLSVFCGYEVSHDFCVENKGISLSILLQIFKT